MATFYEFGDGKLNPINTETAVRLALDRLLLLQLIDEGVNKHKLNPYDPEFHTYIKTCAIEADRPMILSFIETHIHTSLTYPQLDFVSYYTLMAAVTLRHNLKKWVKINESRLQQILVSHVDTNELEEIWLKLHKKHTFQFAKEEEITSSNYLPTTKRYVKVPFEDITLDLIHKTFCYAYKGDFYVDFDNVRELMVMSSMRSWKKFASNLMKNRTEVFESFGGIRPLLTVANALIEIIKSPSVGDFSDIPITLHNIVEVANQYFPPCMESMYNALLKDHELKYDSRKQLVLFLKDIGFSVEDAITLFQQNYSKGTDAKQKVGQIMYYVRHLYGVVGGKRAYRGYACAQIQKHPVNEGQTHGCPFRKLRRQGMLLASGGETLQTMLDRQRVRPDAQLLVQAAVQSEDYTGACLLHLSGRYRTAEDVYSASSARPQDYYRASRSAEDFQDVVDIEDLHFILP